jgi:hypothetical protein
MDERAKGEDRLAVHCERVFQTSVFMALEKESACVAARLGCTPGRTSLTGLLGRGHLQAQRRAVSAAAAGSERWQGRLKRR